MIKTQALHGVMPGQWAPIPRPVPLRMGAYRPVRTLSAHRRAFLSNPTKLSGSFDIESLPVSIGLAGGGVGLLYLSSILPSAVGTVGKVGGIGLLTASFLNLFSGTAQAAGGVDSGEKRHESPDMNALQFVSGQFLKPKLNSDVDRGLFSNDYDVILRWVNNSGKSMSVTYDIHAREEAHGLVFDSEPWEGVVYTGVVNLKPKEEVLVPLELDLQTPTFPAPTFTYITLQLRKYSSAGQEVVVAKNSFYVR